MIAAVSSSAPEGASHTEAPTRARERLRSWLQAVRFATRGDWRCSHPMVASNSGGERYVACRFSGDSDHLDGLHTTIAEPNCQPHACPFLVLSRVQYWGRRFFLVAWLAFGDAAWTAATSAADVISDCFLHCSSHVDPHGQGVRRIFRTSRLNTLGAVVGMSASHPHALHRHTKRDGTSLGQRAVQLRFTSSRPPFLVS